MNVHKKKIIYTSFKRFFLQKEEGLHSLRKWIMVIFNFSIQYCP